jgi:hypothetical protein
VESRLDYRSSPGTLVYDEANKTLYLNGAVQFAGTRQSTATRIGIFVIRGTGACQ